MIPTKGSDGSVLNVPITIIHFVNSLHAETTIICINVIVDQATSGSIHSPTVR